MEHAVAELNKRLERPIQPFKLARRSDMIQRLIYDPKVIEAVADHAAETGVREDVAFHMAQRYAREIVPSFSAAAYFGVAIRAAKWFSTMLFRVRLGHYDEDELKSIDKDATIVFVMNHRSNMDYVLVTYLAAERSALSYAVGEWARIWPLRQLIRAMGAYFIRRKSRNALYRRVLARYVQLATSAGVAQAVFPEGGLSLNGKVGEPKLGILSYVISEYEEYDRDVVFVPVALNYDRVIEDRILIEAEAAGERKFRGSIWSAGAFSLRYFWRRIVGKAHRFGYAAVSFGEPLSLSEFAKDIDGDPTKAVGRELARRIRGVVPVLPVPLVAQLILTSEQKMSRTELIEAAKHACATLQAKGATVHLPREDLTYGVEFGLKHLLTRRILAESDKGIALVEGEEAVLGFYAASIAHLFDADAATKPQISPKSETEAT